MKSLSSTIEGILREKGFAVIEQSRLDEVHAENRSLRLWKDSVSTQIRDIYGMIKY